MLDDTRSAMKSLILEIPNGGRAAVRRAALGGGVAAALPAVAAAGILRDRGGRLAVEPIGGWGRAATSGASAIRARTAHVDHRSCTAGAFEPREP